MWSSGLTQLSDTLPCCLMLCLYRSALLVPQFLRSALSSDACVDVLLLAHHYHCSQLQAEAVRTLPRLGVSLSMRAVLDIAQAASGRPALSAH